MMEERISIKDDPAFEKKKGRHEEIIKAAGKIFSSKGFHRARVEEIAKEAGIGKGTVYEYFKSKRHLFVEVIKYFTTKFLKEFKEAARNGKDYREKLENALGLLIDILHESSGFFELLVRDHWEMDERLYQWMVKVRGEASKVIEDILVEGIKAGKIKDINPRIPAMMLIESSRLALFSGDLGDEKMSPGGLKRAIIDVVLNGILR
jgi:TetR/AcrR family fatty acid metabolism transcriptional regulator